MCFSILRIFTTYLLPFMNNFLKKIGNLLKYCQVQINLSRRLLPVVDTIKTDPMYSLKQNKITKFVNKTWG